MALPSIPSAPTVYNIVLREGASFKLAESLVYTTGGAPVNLTGITVRAKLRLQFTQAAVRAFTCTLSGTPTDGTFTVSMTPANVTLCGGSWLAATTYAANDLVTANGNLYRCTTGGLSAASGTGPSGTGSAITDNAATWTWVQAVPDTAREFSLGFWDLELDDGTDIGRFAEGTVTYSRQATT